jgi:small multidrug resistance family-3 protein
MRLPAIGRLSDHTGRLVLLRLANFQIGHFEDIKGEPMAVNFTTIMKSLLLFLLVGLAEISGGYLVWQWLREGKALWLGFIGGAILFLYGVIPTLQAESAFGRVYAAYGGIFIILSILWGMVFDGWHPDRFDLIGAAIALIGVSIIMWGRLLFR